MIVLEININIINNTIIIRNNNQIGIWIYNAINATNSNYIIIDLIIIMHINIIIVHIVVIIIEIILVIMVINKTIQIVKETNMDIVIIIIKIQRIKATTNQKINNYNDIILHNHNNNHKDQILNNIIRIVKILIKLNQKFTHYHKINLKMDN